MCNEANIEFFGVDIFRNVCFILFCVKLNYKTVSNEMWMMQEFQQKGDLLLQLLTDVPAMFLFGYSPHLLHDGHKTRTHTHIHTQIAYIKKVVYVHTSVVLKK